MSRHRSLLLAAIFACVSRSGSAAPWQIDPSRLLPGVDGVSQKVELVDIDADGFVDLVFANSRGSATGSDADAQRNQLVRNDEGQGFSEWPGVFAEPDNAYVIKAGDLDGDGAPDLVVGVNFLGQSHVLLHDDGAFTRQDILPGTPCSIGDLELGDLDGDGDLDILAADWGTQQPFGEPGDAGGPLRLWLGDGQGGFTDGQARLPLGVETFVSWSFDLELLDFDGDFDLDVMVASRGPGKALALSNDGAGTFTSHPIAALQPALGKDVNTAFAPADLDGDGDLDLVTLHDGPDDGQNSVLIGDGAGDFLDNPGPFWSPADNPARLDLDVATLDFDSDGTPDILVTGPRLGPGQAHNRLFLNSGAALSPAPVPGSAAFPDLLELEHSVGVLLADLDRDGRDDAAVAVADPNVANAVLFGSSDPEGVPEDDAPPHIRPIVVTPELRVHNGDTITLRARVHDAKIPARWHDFRFDLERGDPVHHRRLPYLEFALVDTAEEFLALADDDPRKHVAAGVWYGEALWRFTVAVPPWEPQAKRVHWRVCAIDAAGNQRCAEPSRLSLDPPDTCGDGVVDPWELCDTALPSPCFLCQAICGNCIREPLETPENCPQDGAFGWECNPDTGLARCGDGVCEPDEEDSCSVDCGPDGSGDSGGEASDSATTGGAESEDGCGCRGDATGSASGLALLILLGRRRAPRRPARPAPP